MSPALCCLMKIKAPSTLPSHLIGENAFGDMDSVTDMGRRWHTPFHHQHCSTTQMLGHNKTSDWLARKEVAESAKLMSLARKQRACLRDHHSHRQQEKIVTELTL